MGTPFLQDPRAVLWCLHPTPALLGRSTHSHLASAEANLLISHPGACSRKWTHRVEVLPVTPHAHKARLALCTWPGQPPGQEPLSGASRSAPTEVDSNPVLPSACTGISGGTPNGHPLTSEHVSPHVRAQANRPV